MVTENKISFFHPASLIATFFGIGKIPFAPGTLASILTFPLYVILLISVIKIKGGVTNIVSADTTNHLLFFIAILFLIGTWASSVYSKATGSADPKEVVIDEVVGQLLSWTLIMALVPIARGEVAQVFNQHSISLDNLVYISLIGSLVSFRFLDIFKPWPISWLDKNIKGGLGIMLDDLVASLFSVPLYYGVLFVVIDIIQHLSS